jgi:hypothetical protein
VGVAISWRAAVAVLAIALAACGGGGGGGSSGAPTPGNTAPTAVAGSTQNVLVGALVTLNGAASSDVNGDSLTFAWTLTTRPAGSTASLSGATSPSPTFTADLPGNYVASLVVSDGALNSVAATVTITAATANVAPVANAGQVQNVVVGAVVTLSGAGSSDVNGDSLTYAWSLTTKPAGSTASLAGSSSVSPTFTADLPGSYVASLIVSDGALDSAASTVTITATTGNVAPVANAGPAQTVLVGAVITLNGAASSDANGESLTYAWSLTTRPVGSTASLAGSSSVSPTFTADLPGSYVASLIVSDGQVDSASSDVVISASRAQADTTAPTLSAFSFAPGSVDLASGPATVAVTITAEDAGSGIDYVQMRFASPTGVWYYATVNGQSGVPATSNVTIPANAASGTYVVNYMVVQDKAGNSKNYTTGELTSAGFPTTLAVSNPNEDVVAPSLTGFSFAPMSIDLSGGPATVAVTMTAQDAGSGIDYVQMRFASPTGVWYYATVNGQSGVPATSNMTIPANAASGAYVVNYMVVQDKAGNSKSYTTGELTSAGFPTTLAVSNPNEDVVAPTLTAFSFAPASIDLSGGPATVAVTITAEDAGSGIEYVQMRFASPTGVWYYATVNGQSGVPATSSVTIPANAASGTYVVNYMVVQDKAGNSRSYTTGELASAGFPTTLEVK